MHYSNSLEYIHPAKCNRCQDVRNEPTVDIYCSNAMKEKAELIILYIHHGHSFVLSVITENENKEFELGKKTHRSLVHLLKNKVCHPLFRFVNVAMTLVVSFGYSKTAGVGFLHAKYV